MKYKLKRKFPTNQEFNELFCSVDWGERSDEKINKNRKLSTFALSVYAENEIVAMARVVGDGCNYTIYDLVVKKEHQGKGVGELLVTEIIAWYKLIEDDETSLNLGASKGKEDFYKKYGFVIRPYGGCGAGMRYEPNYNK